jgi:hypothetical protein
MKPSGYAPLSSDRLSTREELLELLELLGGVEELQVTEVTEVTEVAEADELLACLGAESVSPSDLLEGWTANEARLLNEIDAFECLRISDTKTIN